MNLFSFEIRHKLAHDLRMVASYCFADEQNNPYKLMVSTHQLLASMLDNPFEVDLEEYGYFCLLLAENLEEDATEKIIGHRIYKEGKLVHEVRYDSPTEISLWSNPFVLPKEVLAVLQSSGNYVV